MGQSRMAERLQGRRGKFDTVYFKTDDDRLRRALKHLGGTECEEGTPVYFEGPEPKVVPLAGVDKKPVFLTAENFHLVHEPQQHSGTIPVSFSEENVRPDPPPVSERWNGYWGGTEESRVLYLRQNWHLWGWIREENVKRRTGCFFIPKKPGDPRLRKILACIDANNSMREPSKTVLPGPWNVSKIRFRKRRFYTTESDVEAFYSSLVCPKWLLGYFALRPVAASEVLPFSEDGTFTCPVSGETFYPGDTVTPAWPRLPMGFTWSVELATALAHDILNGVAPSGAVSLNIGKNEILKRSLCELYFGSYIDNLFIFSTDLSLAKNTHQSFDQAIKGSGLVLSETDGPRLRRKLLGLDARGEGEHPGLRPPPGLEDEMYTMSTKSYCSFRILERMIGKVSWIASIDRFFFSLFLHGYLLVASLRKRNVRPGARVRLSRKVREEFEFFSILMIQMRARLNLNASPVLVACDASLEAWGIVMRRAGQFGNAFPPDEGLVSSEIVKGLMGGEQQWRVCRRREFRRRLATILPGELTAFRQAAAVAAEQLSKFRKQRERRARGGRRQDVPERVFHRGVSREERESKIFRGSDCDATQDIDQIIFTDNSVVYYSVRKGRSSVIKVNSLCQFLLLIQIVNKVKIQSRWCSTTVMPADYLTREDTFRLIKPLHVM